MSLLTSYYARVVLCAAFTELQTEIPDLTSDVGNSLVPFFDYQHYTFKLLFPDLKLNHPIMQMPTKNVRTTSDLIVRCVSFQFTY